MTLVFGKLVNEFNHPDTARRSQLKAVVDKYAYVPLLPLMECLFNLPHCLFCVSIHRTILGKLLVEQHSRVFNN